MPQKRNKPPRRPLGFFDAQDRVIKLNTIYRTEAFGADRAGGIARQTHRELDDVATPEPDEELEDAELSDGERNAAIARERMRREGRI
jgi:hypothetical protein